MSKEGIEVAKKKREVAAAQVRQAIQKDKDEKAKELEKRKEAQRKEVEQRQAERRRGTLGNLREVMREALYGKPREITGENENENTAIHEKTEKHDMGG